MREHLFPVLPCPSDIILDTAAFHKAELTIGICANSARVVLFLFHMRNHKSASVGLAIAALCAGALALAAPGRAQVWQEQGPGPICNAGATLLPNMCDAADTVMGGKNPAAGAINAIVPSPTDSGVVFVGTVSGGVWKTSNATAAFPTWTPLTDNKQGAGSLMQYTEM